MEDVTFNVIQSLVSCLEFDEATRLAASEHGDWYEHMIDHVLIVERQRRAQFLQSKRD